MDGVETVSAPAPTATPATGAQAPGGLQDALKQVERSAGDSAAPRDPLGGLGGSAPPPKAPSRGGPPKAPAAKPTAAAPPRPGEPSFLDRLGSLLTPAGAASPPAAASPSGGPAKAAPAKLPAVAPKAAVGNPPGAAKPEDASLVDRLGSLLKPGASAPPAAKGAPPTAAPPAKGATPAGPSLAERLDALVKRFAPGKAADKAPAATAPAATAPATSAPIADSANGIAVDSGDADAQASTGAMSQYVWYGAKGTELDYGGVLEVMQTLYDELGVGAGVEVNNAPDAKQIKDASLNPNKGFWWFNKDNHQVWSGKNGGVKYIKNLISHKSKLNGTLTRWLGKNPPGSRSGHMVLEKGKSVDFYDEPLLKKEPKPKKKKGLAPEEPAKAPVVLSTEVPGKLQNLDAANTPSGESCYDTVDAMLLQNGDLGTDGGFKTVTSETYKGDKKGAAIDEVEADVTALSDAVDYLRFETGRGMKVKVGVTNILNTINGGITDHWVLVDRMVTESSFHFLNPSAASTADVNSNKNVLTSDGTTMKGKGYTVSDVKMNTASKKPYAEYKAKKEKGGQAPEKAKEAPTT